MQTASGSLFRTPSDLVMRSSLFWKIKPSQHDVELLETLRARWFAALHRVDEELGLDSKAAQSYLRRGRHCPPLGHNQQLDRGCHLPFCPQCWARRRAVELWKTLYMGLRAFDCRQTQLVWLNFRSQQARSGSSVIDLRRMQIKLEDHPEIRWKGKIAVMQQNINALGGVVIAKVFPTEECWIIEHTTVLLLPASSQLRNMRVAGKTGFWNFHGDWSNVGLARLISLVFRYPYSWLRTSGEDWIAFTEHWKRMRVFSTFGAFHACRSKLFIKEEG